MLLKKRHIILWKTVTSGRPWMGAIIILKFSAEVMYTMKPPKMMPKMEEQSTDDKAILSQLNSLRFRVLVEFDSNYQYYVARCLETDSTATADKLDELKILIKELLEEEITFAVVNNGVEALFSKQAPPETWMRWYRVVRTQQPEKIELTVHVSETRTKHKKMTVGVPTEFALPTAA
jgi:hypothetical protein